VTEPVQRDVVQTARGDTADTPARALRGVHLVVAGAVAVVLAIVFLVYFLA